MNYLRINDEKSVAEFYEQNFKNEFTLTISQSAIVKMKNSGLLTMLDIQIALFLFELEFATCSQLYRAMVDKHPSITPETEEEFVEVLNKLVQNRVINKFMFVESKNPELRKVVYDDALQVYCLDLGGKYLLGNYAQVDVINWTPAICMKAPILIFKSLDIVDFYLNLMSTCPKKVVSFRLRPSLRIGKTLATPDVDMCLKINDNERHFIIQFISADEYPHKYKDKTYQLEGLLTTKAWSKYYGTNKLPMLFFVAHDDYSALDVAKFVEALFESVPGISYAFTTNERLTSRKLNEAGGFMRFVGDELTEIKAATFNP